jgi:hypothetical protein
MFLTIFVCESRETTMRGGGGINNNRSRCTHLCVSGRPERERELFPHPISQVDTKPFDGCWPPKVLLGGYIP